MEFEPGAAPMQASLPLPMPFDFFPITMSPTKKKLMKPLWLIEKGGWLREVRPGMVP
jgi:hypothetical protein